MTSEANNANTTACVTRITAGDPPGGSLIRTPGTSAAKSKVDIRRLPMSICLRKRIYYYHFSLILEVVKMEKFKIGTLTLDRKYLVVPNIYSDWRDWAIGRDGGIALMEAVKNVTGYRLKCDWYGAPGDPYNAVDTATPTEYQITFCGSIEGIGIVFDGARETGKVNFYKYCNPIDVEREQDTMAIWIQQMSTLLAKDGE